MSGLLNLYWMILHGGLHLTWKDKVVSVVGVGRPSVLRLSLRLNAFGCVGGVGGLGLAASIVPVVFFFGKEIC